MWGQMRSDAVSLTAHSALTSAYINNQSVVRTFARFGTKRPLVLPDLAAGSVEAAPLLDAAGAPAAREVPQLSPAHPSRQMVLCGASDLASR
jgi:hypothetical protein